MTSKSKNCSSFLLGPTKILKYLALPTLGTIYVPFYCKFGVYFCPYLCGRPSSSFYRKIFPLFFILHRSKNSPSEKSVASALRSDQIEMQNACSLPFSLIFLCSAAKWAGMFFEISQVEMRLTQLLERGCVKCPHSCNPFMQMSTTLLVALRVG